MTTQDTMAAVTSSPTRPADAALAHAEDAREWLQPLRATSGAEHDDALARLHGLLLRACGHEARRRVRAFGLDLGDELQVLIEQSADDALVAVLSRLDSFEGRSRFTTWAFKFGIHVAGVAVRQAAWRSRSIPTSDDALEQLRGAVDGGTERTVEQRELLRAITDAVATLTPRQREVLLALAVDGVPIDVLAERMSTTRGALYKALHDARIAVRRRLVEAGMLAHAGSEVLDDH